MSASAGKGRVSMLLKDHWYVACPSSQLPAGSPRATQIGNLDLVWFRDTNGSVRALLGRCCHRGVRLSLGRVKDGHVACGYHGWEFDSEGSLKLVPSLTLNDKMPACSIPAFLAVEKDFYVWVWIAGKNERPTYEPALLAIERRNFIQHTGVWNVDIMEAVENQLDMAHPAFSHPGIYPGHRSVDGEIPPLHQFAVECRVVDGGVEAFLPPTAQSGQEPRSFNQLVSWVRYELPYRNYVHLVRLKTFAIYNWTPLADGTCRVDFMVTFDADCEQPSLDRPLHSRTKS